MLLFYTCGLLHLVAVVKVGKYSDQGHVKFMTTRSGLSYKQEATMSVQELMQFLMVDRKKREEEIAEERQWREKEFEVERKRREEKRDAREAESRKRLKEM